MNGYIHILVEGRDKLTRTIQCNKFCAEGEIKRLWEPNVVTWAADEEGRLSRGGIVLKLS